MSRSASPSEESARSSPSSESSADPSHLQINVNGANSNGVADGGSVKESHSPPNGVTNGDGGFIAFGGDDSEASMDESSESEGLASEPHDSPPPDKTVDVLKLTNYFPSFDSNGKEIVGVAVERCMVCTDMGHPTSSCPELTCSTCGAKNEHFTHACPKKKRCPRCRQTGHGLGTCSEHAVKTADAVCDLCHEKGHLETACSLLWRTSTQIEPVKVANLVMACYFCGSAAHYGGDCPIRKARKRNFPIKSSLGGHSSFSMANASQFVTDPTTAFKSSSTKRARLPERPRSPDDDFFRTKLPPTKPRGKMSMMNIKKNQAKIQQEQGSSYRPAESRSLPQPPAHLPKKPETSSAAPSLRDLFPSQVSARPNVPLTLGGHAVEPRDKFPPHNQRSGRPRSRSPSRNNNRNDSRQRSPPRGPRGRGGGRGRGRGRR